MSLISKLPGEVGTAKQSRIPTSGAWFVLMALGLLVFLLAVVRVVSGADDLTSSGTVGAALAL